MTLWLAWTVAASALIGIATAAIEQIAALLGAPRRSVWIGALLACTVGPVLLALRSTPAGPLPEVAAPRGPEVATAILRRNRVPAAAAAIDATVGAIVPSRTATALDIPPLIRRADWWVARGWLIASTVLMALLVRSLAGLSRRRSQWSDEDIEIGRVLVSPDAGPAVIGLIRPRIVLPSWAMSIDRSTRELLLRHELEHIRARDTTTLLLAELVVIAFPWNAVLWWMRRRLRSAIEIDCDRRVIRATGDAHAYGLALLAVGERHAASLPLATAWSERRIQLESRIKAMTAPRPRRPTVASLPFVAVAVGLVATTAWSPRPQPLSSAARAILGSHATAPGITFAIDTAAKPALARNAFDTFRGIVLFASERGRVDIVATSGRGSIRVIKGVPVAAPLGAAGDYYLFDSTGFVLVRPASRTFSTFSMPDAAYDYRDSREGWPAMFEFDQNRSDTILTGDAAAGPRVQHGAAHIYWHLDSDLWGTGPSIARGRIAIADTPASDVSVARWFGPAQALAHLSDLASIGAATSVRVTTMAQLSPPGGAATTNFGSTHYLSSLKRVDVDLSQLTLPEGYLETPWPGFERSQDRPALSVDRGARWRTVPPPGR